MSELREIAYEVLFWGDDYQEGCYASYASLQRARDAASQLREQGFETEIYKLTIYEELIEDE
jgi:hypothetical protein